jgi:hypothetical protein
MFASTDLPCKKIGDSTGDEQLDCGFLLAIFS